MRATRSFALGLFTIAIAGLSVALLEARSGAAPAIGHASQAAAPALSAAWTALLGDWKGEGGGAPGAGAGGESFRYDLDKHVITRRGTSDYPAANGRPATHHEDLTVIYPPPSRDDRLESRSRSRRPADRSRPTSRASIRV